MMPPILEKIKSLGYAVFINGDYNLNLFGIRSTNRNSNSFDDLLGCAYKLDGQWKVEYWQATTDPGLYWLNNPTRVSGTAILVPGQYRGVYKIDLHAGKYKALCQRNGKVRVYRDRNKDSVLDMDSDTIASGFFGINIHRSSLSGESEHVERWSAGCQVHKTLVGFNRMMELARKQVSTNMGSTFTYTLLTEEQLG
tara:strand:+ start:99 stop:686 length:588 start_codon:yes stop_codon:yes gene_type:complete